MCGTLQQQAMAPWCAPCFARPRRRVDSSETQGEVQPSPELSLQDIIMDEIHIEMVLPPICDPFAR